MKNYELRIFKNIGFNFIRNKITKKYTKFIIRFCEVGSVKANTRLPASVISMADIRPRPGIMLSQYLFYMLKRFILFY